MYIAQFLLIFVSGQKLCFNAICVCVCVCLSRGYLEGMEKTDFQEELV